MRQSRERTIRMGIFIATGVLLFILSIYFIGSRQNLFSPDIKISTSFKDVKGLRMGAGVLFTGINVGSVSKMQILSDTSVLVEMSIEKKVTRFIKKDSPVTIGTQGLMGNKIILILPGSADESSIEQGDNLPSLEAIEVDDIMREIKISSERISVVSGNLIDITEKINQGEGVFGKLFTDTTFTYNLNQTSNNLVEISDRLNRGEGLLGRLFSDTTMSANLDSTGQYIMEISRDIENITAKINRGEGVIGRLTTDTSLTQNIFQASKNLKMTTANLEQGTRNLIDITTKMNAGEGVFNKFLVDSVFADSLDIVLRELNQTLIEVRIASEAVQGSRLFKKSAQKAKEKDNK